MTEPNLIEELGLDPDDLTWTDLALCGGREGSQPMDVNWFFEDYESDKELAKAIDEVCLSCPVLKQCLSKGMSQKNDGVWGGVFLNRGKSDTTANAHKTTEVWERIEEKLRS